MLTALTAQNTRGVTAILPVPAEFVTQQIDAVAGDLRIAAVKTGMLNDRATVLAVVEGVRRHALHPLVVDPVMVATSGDMLLQPDAVEAVRRELLPLADIITPNLAEAARLLGSPSPPTCRRWRRRRGRCWRWAPRRCCSRAGTVRASEAVDILRHRDATPVRLALPRIDTRNTHGTGCTLSAAIAAGLARGESLQDAVASAKHFVHAALVGGPRAQNRRRVGPCRSSAYVAPAPVNPDVSRRRAVQPVAPMHRPFLNMVWTTCGQPGVL